MLQPPSSLLGKIVVGNYFTKSSTISIVFFRLCFWLQILPDSVASILAGGTVTQPVCFRKLLWAFMPGRPFFGREWFPFWGTCRVGLGRFASGTVGLVERRFDCTSSLCWIPLEASEAFVFLRPPAAEYNGSEKAQLVAEPQQIAFPVALAKWLRVRVSPAGFWLIFQAGPPTARQPRCS